MEHGTMVPGYGDLDVLVGVVLPHTWVITIHLHPLGQFTDLKAATPTCQLACLC